MRVLFLGEYIKRRRLELGLTQAQLCEGICAPITVSRMENGKQMPTYQHIRAFLQRLGLPDDRCFVLLSQDEIEIKILQDELHADAIRFQWATPENTSRICMEGLKKLEKLERLAEPDDQIIQQYILHGRTIFSQSNDPSSAEERLHILMKALHMTVPNCNLEKLNLKFYTLEEIFLLNTIAATYANMGQQKKAVDIHSQLLEYVREHCEEMSQYAENFSLISHNYALELFLMEDYDNAMKIADLGRKICVKYAYYQFLPGLLNILGECCFYKGDREKCKKYYQSAYLLYCAIENDRDRMALEKDAMDQLGLEFSA